MCKISVLFKPSQSGVNNELQNIGFYETDKKRFFLYEEKIINVSKGKLRIKNIKMDEIFEIYSYLLKNYGDGYIFILIVKIDELFGDEEREELSKITFNPFGEREKI